MHVVRLCVALLALLVVLFNAVIYAMRSWSLRRADDCDREERLGLVDAMWAFVVECVATAAGVLLIPIGWLVPRCRGGAGQRGAVILVHGWGLNRGAWWLLRRRLLRDGWSPICSFDYWSLTADIESAAQGLHAYVQHVAPAGQPVMLVGHSLGGLVLRTYVRRHRVPQVRRLMTLGTPHFGTELASRGPLREQLAPGAPLLLKLNAVDHVPQQFDVIAISSTFDAMVLPPASARYPGAFNIQLNNVGHNALLFSAKVYQLVAENLAAPLTPKPPQAQPPALG